MHVPLIVLLLLALFTIPLAGAFSLLFAMGVPKTLAGGIVIIAGLALALWLVRGEDA